MGIINVGKLNHNSNLFPTLQIHQEKQKEKKKKKHKKSSNSDSEGEEKKKQEKLKKVYYNLQWLCSKRNVPYFTASILYLGDIPWDTLMLNLS